MKMMFSSAAALLVVLLVGACKSTSTSRSSSNDLGHNATPATVPQGNSVQHNMSTSDAPTAPGGAH